VSGEQHLLVGFHSSYFQIVLHSLEPIVGVEGLLGLAKHRRVGVLEVLELGSGVVMISMDLVGDVLQGDEVGLAFGSLGFPVSKHGLQ
jgi:hypothetical protein